MANDEALNQRPARHGLVLTVSLTKETSPILGDPLGAQRKPMSTEHDPGELTERPERSPEVIARLEQASAGDGVELRFFSGLIIAETDRELGVGKDTVEDDRGLARASAPSRGALARARACRPAKPPTFLPS